MDKDIILKQLDEVGRGLSELLGQVSVLSKIADLSEKKGKRLGQYSNAQGQKYELRRASIGGPIFLYVNDKYHSAHSRSTDAHAAASTITPRAKDEPKR